MATSLVKEFINTRKVVVSHLALVPLPIERVIKLKP